MAKARGPVCGMDVDSNEAAAMAQYQGQNYYFCSPSCKEKFDGQPGQYVGREKGKVRKSA